MGKTYSVFMQKSVWSKTNRKQQEGLWRHLGRIIQQNCIWWSQQVFNNNIGTLQAMHQTNDRVQRSLLYMFSVLLCTWAMSYYSFICYHVNNSIWILLHLLGNFPAKQLFIRNYWLVKTNKFWPNCSERQEFVQNLSCNFSFGAPKVVKDSSISASGAFYHNQHQLIQQVSSFQVPHHRFWSLRERCSYQFSIHFSFSVYFPHTVLYKGIPDDQLNLFYITFHFFRSAF